MKVIISEKDLKKAIKNLLYEITDDVRTDFESLDVYSDRLKNAPAAQKILKNADDLIKKSKITSCKYQTGLKGAQKTSNGEDYIWLKFSGDFYIRPDKFFRIEKITIPVDIREEKVKSGKDPKANVSIASPIIENGLTYFKNDKTHSFYNKILNYSSETSGGLKIEKDRMVLMFIVLNTIIASQELKQAQFTKYSKAKVKKAYSKSNQAASALRAIYYEKIKSIVEQIVKELIGKINSKFKVEDEFKKEKFYFKEEGKPFESKGNNNYSLTYYEEEAMVNPNTITFKIEEPEKALEWFKDPDNKSKKDKQINISDYLHDNIKDFQGKNSLIRSIKDNEDILSKSFADALIKGIGNDTETLFSDIK